MDEDDDLGPVVTIDLRAVRIRLQECEGDLLLLVDDGDVEVEFGSGVGGTYEQAILGAERLASTALAYAQALRSRRPNRPLQTVALADVAQRTLPLRHAQHDDADPSAGVADSSAR